MTRSFVLVAGSGLVGLAFVGRGFVNGDVAAYCAQAWAWDLADRSVHLGYVALATALGVPAGRHLPLALDVVNVASALVAAFLARRLATEAPTATGLTCAALLLPWAPFAEVDVPWMTLVLASAVGIPGSALAATVLSPTALLALPWAAWHRRCSTPLWEGGVAVLLLTLVSQGDWWWGPRGVLESRPWLIGRNLGSWSVTIPWLVLLTGRLDRGLVPLLLLTPLLLAPADVPVAVLVGIVATARALSDAGPPSKLARVARGAAIAWALTSAVVAAEARAARVAEEHRIILGVLRDFDPGDGLVAPFTWGARASVIATGDPYGLPWHPEGRFLRDQRSTWAHVDGTIWVLPPSASATPTHHRRSAEP